MPFIKNVKGKDELYKSPEIFFISFLFRNKIYSNCNVLYLKHIPNENGFLKGKCSRYLIRNKS